MPPTMEESGNDNSMDNNSDENKKIVSDTKLKTMLDAEFTLDNLDNDMMDGLSDVDGQKSTTVLFKFDTNKEATYNVSIKDSGSRKRKIAFAEDHEMRDNKSDSKIKPFEDSEDEYQQKNTEQE